MSTPKLHKTLPQIQRLYDRGLKSVIPLFKGKGPGYSEWQKITDEEAQEKIWGWSEKHKDSVVNYGIRLGSGFGGICDIDLDSEECRRLARYYLPDTAKFGRGGIVTHYLYKCSGKLVSRRYAWDKRDEKSLLLEFRASGQTMAPGSVHPDTGEAIEWYSGEGVNLFECEGELLEQNVRELAAAALLLRDWQSGGRDELAVCLVGSMIRSGWEDMEIDRFMMPILVESGDEENEKRLKAERLREQLEKDGRVPGLKRLREVCGGGSWGTRGFDALVEWLELGGGDLIEQMNAEFAVVVNSGQASILRELSGEEGIQLMNQRDFGLLMANKKTLMGGKMVTADKFWLSHADRREYKRGVVFKPCQEAREGEYNLWRGFAVREEEGTWGVGWELYLDHLRDEVCDGDAVVYDWFIKWLAHRVQRPWELPRSALVLKGERGSGKGFVFRVFGELFGPGYKHITDVGHLLGRFNAHLAGCVFLFADEVVWGGDKKGEGVLQGLITEPTRLQEDKGIRAFTVANCMGLAMCTNNDWAVPVGRMERRFLVLQVGNGHRGDRGWWDRFARQMSVEGGGLGRMLYDLRRVDLEGWAGDMPPVTDALLEQQDRGMEKWVQFFEEWFDRKGDGKIVAWGEDLYRDYSEWCIRHRAHLETGIVFGKLVRRLMISRHVKSRVNRGGSNGERVMRDRYTFWEGMQAVREFKNGNVGQGD